MSRYGSSQVSSGYALSSGKHTRKPDHSSEEIILPIQGQQDLGNHVKTTMFTVASDKEQTGSSDFNGRESVIDPQWAIGDKV